MICFPNAKINLGLRVLRKRADGFHDIETVFFPIPLCDILELVVLEPGFVGDRYLELRNARRLYYAYSGNAVVDNPETELSVRAIMAFDREFGVTHDLFLHLHKNIPSGAGLGGGSSDAANALKIINSIEGEKTNESILMKLAASLGSDCPFFISNKPSFASGRGEILQSISISLSGYHLVLVKPSFGVSTAEAYSGVVPKCDPDAPSLIDIVKLPIDSWPNILVNEFENGVFEVHPQLAQIKSELYEMGASYASMSGSGSTMFGLFKTEPELEGTFNDLFVFKTAL